MSDQERRQAERLLLTIPIRVLAFGGHCGSFSEDTQTIEVSRAGARIALKHRVGTDDTLRIINLETLSEADFRVAGASRLDIGEFAEWGVECLDTKRNIWGIDFPPPLADDNSQASALLVCRDCGKQGLYVLSLMEVDLVNSTGMLRRLCDQCGELSTWTYADITRRPKEPPVPEHVVPPPPADPGKAEKRVHKRLPLKLPVLVRNNHGAQEVAKTANISKGGLAVALGLKLAVGEIVNVVCPYTAGSQNLEQKAEVRRRLTVTEGQKWLYGFRNII